MSSNFNLKDRFIQVSLDGFNEILDTELSLEDNFPFSNFDSLDFVHYSILVSEKLDTPKEWNIPLSFDISMREFPKVLGVIHHLWDHFVSQFPNLTVHES